MLLPRAIPTPHVGVLGRFALCYDPRRTPTRRTCTVCYWILARNFHPKRVLFCMPAKSRHNGVFMFFLGYSGSTANFPTHRLSPEKCCLFCVAVSRLRTRLWVLAIVRRPSDISFIAIKLLQRGTQHQEVSSVRCTCALLTRGKTGGKCTGFSHSGKMEFEIGQKKFK